MTSWEDTLDSFEASLDRHRQLVDHEVLDGTNPWPPASLPDGPIPEPLRDRASALLSENNRLIDDVVSKMATMSPPKPSRYGRHRTPAVARWSTSL